MHFLSPNNMQIIIRHINENAKEKGIFIDTINGGKEHVHCTISLGSDQTISKVIQLIKGESSRWINKQNLFRGMFEWADEYYAVSVSESEIQKVRTYINNQEEHHHSKTWNEECEELLLKYGFKKILG